MRFNGHEIIDARQFDQWAGTIDGRPFELNWKYEGYETPEEVLAENPQLTRDLGPELATILAQAYFVWLATPNPS